MTLTPRYRLGLTLLAALALVDLLVWLFVVPPQRSPAPASDDGTAWVEWNDAPPDGPSGVDGPSDPDGLSGLEGRGSASPIPTSDGPEVHLVAARVEMRTALARRPIDWLRIRDILVARPEVLDDLLAAQLLERFEEAPHGRGLVEAFAAARHPSLFPALLTLAVDQRGRGPLGQAALDALGSLPGLDGDATVEALLPHLGRDPREDAPWLTAIARVGGTRGLEAIVAYLGRISDPARVPQSAIQGLRGVDRTRAGELLGEALDRSREDDERAVLLLLAGAVRAAGLEERLVDLMTNASSGHVAVNAARALGEQRTPAAIDALVRIARTDDDAAAHARGALQQMRGGELPPDAIERLRVLLREENPSPDAIATHGIAMGVLAAHGDTASLSVIASRVVASDDAAAAPAVSALGTFGARARHEVPRLVARFATASPPLQSAIVQSLGQIGGADAVAALQRFSEQEPTNAGLKSHVLHALRRARAAP